MSSEKRKSTVSTRQVQKRAKQESDAALQNVEVDESWLLGVDVDSAFPDDGAVASSSGSGPASVPCDEEAGDNEVIVTPTDFSQLFPDAAGQESSDEEIDDEEPETLVSRLRRWYVEAKINLKQLGMLLEELRPIHPELPKDPRTVVETPRTTVVKNLSGGGSYVHIGLAKGLSTRLLECGSVQNTKRLGIDVNIDGLPLFQSGAEAWPILGRSLDLVDKRPFVIGFYSGSSKPSPIEDYLEDYIQEAKVLLKDGLEFQDEKYEVYIRCYICDAPARAYLKLVKGHSGYSACEKCIQEGEWDGARVVFDPIVSTLRTEESFLCQDDDEHHRGESPLLALNTNFIEMFPLDPMHLLFAGVLKRFFLYLLGVLKGGNARLSAAQISLISNNLISLQSHMPREFARIPRSLEAFKRWKITELGQLLRYTGPAVLNDCMPVEVYNLFLLLHVATRIVSHPVLVKDSSYLDYAENLFSTFVQHCAHPTVFKPAFVVYDEHSLLHLVDDVRKFGNIFDFSAFPFENFLGILKRIVRSGVHITQQVARRLEEMDGFVAAPKCTPSHFIPHNFDETKGEFKYLVCKDFTLSPHYKKDAFFKTQDSIGRVLKIMKTSDGFKIRANVCSKLEDFYSYPLPSHKVGIFKVSRWSSLDVEIDPACITTKVMVIPSKAGWMAAELLHCVN